jgi:hypothetical protein
MDSRRSSPGGDSGGEADRGEHRAGGADERIFACLDHVEETVAIVLVETKFVNPLSDGLPVGRVSRTR